MAFPCSPQSGPAPAGTAAAVTCAPTGAPWTVHPRDAAACPGVRPGATDGYVLVDSQSPCEPFGTYVNAWFNRPARQQAPIMCDWRAPIGDGGRGGTRLFLRDDRRRGIVHDRPLGRRSDRSVIATDVPRVEAAVLQQRVRPERGIPRRDTPIVRDSRRDSVSLTAMPKLIERRTGGLPVCHSRLRGVIEWWVSAVVAHARSRATANVSAHRIGPAALFGSRTC